MRIKSLESLACMAFIGVGAAAFMTIGMAEETASPFLLRQERALGALDYASLPTIYAVALILLAVANLALMWFKGRQNAERADGGATDEESAAVSARARRDLLLRSAGTAVLLVAYTAVMPYVHFFASTGVFLFLLFYLYGQRDLKRVVPISLVGALFFWVVFIKVANLPIGIG